jgi:hypothetical protein
MAGSAAGRALSTACSASNGTCMLSLGCLGGLRRKLTIIVEEPILDRHALPPFQNEVSAGVIVYADDATFWTEIFHDTTARHRLGLTGVPNDDRDLASCAIGISQRCCQWCVLCGN